MLFSFLYPYRIVLSVYYNNRVIQSTNLDWLFYQQKAACFLDMIQSDRIKHFHLTKRKNEILEEYDQNRSVYNCN